MSKTSSNNNTRIAKNTLMLYFRMLLLLVINLYTSRVILRELGVDDYGIYNVVGGIIVILSFLNNAMATGTQRFMNVEMGRNDQIALNNVFSTSQQIHFFVAVAILLIAETIGLWFLNTHMNIPDGRMVAANWVYQFSVAAAIFGIFTVPYNAAIISHEKMSAFAYISIFEAALKLLVAFALILIHFDKLIFYAALIFIIGVISCGIYAIYGIRHFTECRSTTVKINRPMMKKMLSFSGWTVFGNLGYILHTQGIAIVINMFFSVAINAAQGIANQVNGVVTQFTANFLIALNPQVVKTYAAGDFKQMHSLIIRGSKMAFCLMSFFVIPLALEAPTVLQIWLGIVPDYTIIFVRLILLISLVNSFSSLMSAAKGATGNIRNYQITLTTIGAFHVPLAWVLYKFGAGPEYAMYVYLVIVIILQAFRIWFVCRSTYLKMLDFVKQVIVRCIVVLLLSSTIPTILHLVLQKSIWTTILIGISSSLSVISATLYVALTEQERHLIINFIKNKINNK